MKRLVTKHLAVLVLVCGLFMADMHDGVFLIACIMVLFHGWASALARDCERRFLADIRATKAWRDPLNQEKH